MPALNSPEPISGVRRPRLRVTVGGKESFGAFEAQVTTNNRLEAARFSCSFALSYETELNAGWWSEQKDVPVAVHVGFLMDDEDETRIDWKLLVSGATDSVHYQPVQGVVRVDGRDLASRLIDATTRETFANMRASEIVQLLAARHDMQADVTPTQTLAGEYYQLEHDKMTLDGFAKATKEWDLLVYLAQRENYDLWVDGDTIRFHPSEKPDTENPWVVRFAPPEAYAKPRELNASGLTCERSLTVAKDLTVVVKSFAGKSNRRVEAKYPKGGGSGGGANKKNVQQRVFVRPGLSPGQAEKEAERLHKEITQNERVINLQMPGDLALTPRMMIRLEGTRTSWDQHYYVDELVRGLGWEEGFTQTCRAKNSSPRNEANVG